MPEKVELGPMKDVKHNGLAKTPPMGWNSWNKFRDQVSDKLVREVADGMVRNGLKDAGYVYVNIDDTWEGPRDANGNITTNDRFPNMKALGDYIHSKGTQVRHLLIAWTLRLARDTQAVTSMRSRMRRLMPHGGWII